MASTYYGSSWSVQVNQEMIDVTSGYPSPDPHWRMTDSQGHEHFYEHGYPTLDLVVDEQHWCDGNEGIARHDPHMQIDESHYECKQCREVIEPHLLPAFTPQQIPGMIEARLVGFDSNGLRVTASLTQDELAAITPDSTDTDIAALLDAIPRERVLLVEFSG